MKILQLYVILSLSAESAQLNQSSHKQAENWFSEALIFKYNF